MHALFLIVLTLSGAAVLCWRRAALRGITLMGPWCWTMIAWLAVGAAATSGALGWLADGSMASYLASIATVCPLMALMGARRPQDGGWPFVVMTLWLILALPALEVLLVRPGNSMEISGARSWFLAGLVAVGFLSLVPTRHWFEALLLLGGQTLLLGPWLPALEGRIPAVGETFGMILIWAALLVASLRPSRREVRPHDRLWLDFRDHFGFLWGLRIAQRINAVAVAQEWDLELCWRGFRCRSTAEPTDIPESLRPALRQTIEGLFRRFVNSAWIDRRLNE